MTIVEKKLSKLRNQNPEKTLFQVKIILNNNNLKTYILNKLKN